MPEVQPQGHARKPVKIPQAEKRPAQRRPNQPKAMFAAFIITSLIIGTLEYFMATHAPKGWQDRDGFHHGDHP